MSRKEDEYLIERMGKLLAEIAIIVNGWPPDNISWSYHDLPEKVRALKQAPPAAAVPPGYALVPVEPTKAMVLAGERELDRHDFLRLGDVYRAMLAAAERKGVGNDQ